MYLFVGNHDAYFKGTIEVNSLSPFQNIPNIHVIDKAEEVNFICGDKYALFMPWDCFDEKKYKKNQYDYMFGHFEFAGAEFNAAMTCKHGYSGSSLTDAAPLVFSGHFHKRKEYEYRNGKIVTVGCPLELDWSDYGNSKGIYLFKPKSGKYEFIENTVTPKHIKLYLTKLFTNPEPLYNVSGNYIRFIIDTNYKFEQVMKLVGVINKMSPLKPCETEFTVNRNFYWDGSDDDIDTQLETAHMTKLDYLFKFIQKTPEDQLGELTPKRLEKLMKNYYEKANTKVTE
jgi:hypothetical protein